MIDNLWITVHAFTSHILMLFSIDETLLPRYVNISTNLRESPVSFLIKTHVSCFVCIHIETNIYEREKWGLSTLVKEFSATARIMQSSSKELSTLVADRV